ncbi:MAG TPA: hypothetical protein VF175_18195 [Lacipirellula sp.]
MPQTNQTPYFYMNRRRFVFWFSFGLFSLAERLRIYGLDELAAATLRAVQPPASGASSPAVHWRAASNELWRWYERETLIDGQWQLSGITTPINKETGEPYHGQVGYLEERLVPDNVRRGSSAADAPPHEDFAEVAATEFTPRRPHPMRQARHGRPPSKWLRSLNADELRIWLKTIDVPEAGVSGMTFWEHLTRDHEFDPAKIEGLIEADQAKLHAAAHYGY